MTYPTRLGLLLGVLCFLPGAVLAELVEERVVLKQDADGVQRGALVLDSYSYQPRHLVVRAGAAVELVLTSVTLLTPHNFVLRDLDAGLNVDQDVGAGDTVTVRFTPSKPGLYTFYCDKKLLFFASHREKGMEGLLEVRE